ncbi:MAG: Ig domain-containing protein [Myxococcota bacterium]
MRARTLPMMLLALTLAGGCGDDGDAAGGEADARDVSADAPDAVGGDVSEPDAAMEDTRPDIPEQPPEPICPPETRGCFDGQIIVCDKAGLSFDLLPCDEGLMCVEGECLECGSDDDCGEGEICRNGSCQLVPLEIVTTELTPEIEGVPFFKQLFAEGGLPPYEWSIVQGELPEGVSLSADGVMEGSSLAVASWPFKVKVTDSTGQEETAPLTLEILEHGLHITTNSPLPLATAGDPYEVAFEAVGGEQPYIWGLSGGELPPGMTMSSDGVLSGNPNGDGSFDLTVKVFDSSNPALWASRDFTLPVKFAPLQIIGDNEVDLLVTDLIVLPLLISTRDFQIPYTAELEARGGKKPYHWSVEPMPGFVDGLIPNSGLPDGLSIAEDGTISGSVADPSKAVQVKIPGTSIDLRGFFFAARCRDDQPVPFEETAVYIIPTLPVFGAEQ